MAVKTPPSVRSDEALTPRQREVLALIVQGRTNAQIAEALGITLDGAKWHVSEIITRLDVESREEAAEYWRAEHGLRLRFSRMLRSLLPGSAVLKFAAGGTVVAIAAAAVAAVVIVLQQSNDEHPASSATPPATAPATSPAATPGATATAGPGAEVIDGVTVQTLSIGSDTTLPAGLVVYYLRAGYATDGYAANIHRAYRDLSGTLQENYLTEPLNAMGTPYTSALDIDSGRIAVGICTQGYCGGVGAPSDDSRSVLSVSSDGGISWSHLGELPHASFVEAISVDAIILNTYIPGAADDTGIWKYQLFPSLQELTGPAEARPIFFRGAIAWHMNDGSIVAPSGAQLSAAPPQYSDVSYQPYPTSRIPATANSDPMLTWLRHQQKEPAHWYIGQTDGTGTLTAAYTWEGQDLRGIIAVGPNLVLGNVFPPQTGFGYFPVALIALDSRTIHPVPELTADSPNTPGGQSFVITAQTGNFARVNTGSDCLNVREKASASAKSLGCFKDGVLLRILPGSVPEADGITWQPVATPGDQVGYASAEFLAR